MELLCDRASVKLRLLCFQTYVSAAVLAHLLLTVTALSWPIVALFETFGDVKKLINASNLLLLLLFPLVLLTGSGSRGRGLASVVPRHRCAVETLVKDSVFKLLGQNASLGPTGMCD